ncbi:MAG TPA: hypothetical protein VKE94_01725 [Gemmataceae bacterium]|nr:hypothetical protein [Gemmataceae bacterium]
MHDPKGGFVFEHEAFLPIGDQDGAHSIATPDVAGWRKAVPGIFVFEKGCEPVEFDNFKRIDNDFYCTVDKSTLAEGGPFPSLWAAYELARVQAVTALRKEAGGKLDLERIQQHIDGAAAWVPRLGEIVTKANTVQNSGKAIETTAKQIKDDIEERVEQILALLRLDVE